MESGSGSVPETGVASWKNMRFSQQQRRWRTCRGAGRQAGQGGAEGDEARSGPARQESALS